MRIRSTSSGAISGLKLKVEARVFSRPWMGDGTVIVNSFTLPLSDTTLAPGDHVDVVALSNETYEVGQRPGHAWIGDYQTSSVKMKDGRYYLLKYTVTGHQIEPHSAQLIARNNNMEAKIFDVYGPDYMMEMMAYEGIPSPSIESV